MPEAKYRHSVCVLDGLMYVMGGEDSDQTLASVHRFDPVVDTWSEVVPMSFGRSGFGALVLNGSPYLQ
jgi:N-acetylneuraminic acid mutarotase